MTDTDIIYWSHSLFSLGKYLVVSLGNHKLATESE